MSCDPEQLVQEAFALHRAVFGFEPPEHVGQHYLEAHRCVLLNIDDAESKWMRRVIEIGADIEALELVFRIRQPGRVLCHKLKLLVYITEAYPEYYCYFVNENPQRLWAFSMLTLHSLRTLYKYFKGLCLLRSLVK